MRKFLKENRKFMILFLIAVSIRFVNIAMPILEGTATRQVQTAMVARNFFKSGFNLMTPEVDHYGPGKTYLVLEFPLLNFLAATGYKLLGGVHEWVGRFWSIVFFAGGLVLLYLLARQIYGKEVAFWAAFTFSFSPLSVIFSRAFMPDFEMLFFSLAAIYFMYLYTEREEKRYFWLSSVSFLCALLAKPHSFYIFVPLIYLLAKKEKIRMFLRLENWLYAILAILPAILWYRHAAAVQSLALPQESYNFSIFHWMRLGEFISADLYWDLINIYNGIFLTPIGFSLLLFGLFIKTKDKENLMWAWAGGIMLFFLVFVSHIDDPYYNLGVLPVASLFIARSIVFLKERLSRSKLYIDSGLVKFFFILLVALFVLRYALYAYIVPRDYRYIPEAGKAVQEITEPQDLVIASSASTPAALYFCDRKGWPLLIPGSGRKKTMEAIEKLESYREKGARYFLTAVIQEFNSNGYFRSYMLKNYRVVKREPGKYIVFSLQ